MKIALELHNTRYTVESDGDDFDGNELKELFSRIMVVAGYSPSVIELGDGGEYEYVAEDEIVVKKEVLDNG